MDFLGIGGGEIFLILVVVLLLWGPGRIMEISRTLGKMVHTFKTATTQFTAQINKELEEEKKEEPPKPQSHPQP